ncbi:unnamed protein product [Pieris brassicae]|uniref:AAA+ ATPase domain-containing protein n=1 Tax=Pieris brassicae TaxID=7116 RepID=A0A9P0XLC0_PIEBR|nr:unnamed protein product [Pieris brassicae]
MFVHGIKPGSSEEEEEEDVMDILQKRREECERKARRGEMDPRLEFTFQLLIDGTGLPRHAIMDHVFEGNMLDDINQLFLPHMRNKLLWYYQDVEEVEARPQPENTKPRQQGQGKQPPPQITLKKKLFLSDGWDVKFTGVCIYMFRINVSKQLPEEGFHKDLFCGILNAEQVGLVTAIERVMEHVYMNALAHPSTDGDEDETKFPIVKNQLLPGLRSFCSALKVCEDVCNQVNLFDDGQALMANLQDHTELKEMTKNLNTITMLEDRVTEWIKKIMEILSESEQLRREVDSSGPQDELEYWKKRGAQFSQLVSYLQDHEVQLTLTCLQLANSKVIKLWRDTDHKITFCYNEAKDNAKFVQAMEKCCHTLYLDDPVNIKDSILSLLQTVRLIHSVSQFYNTSERISSLMVKITNQMIETCKQYITCRFKDTIWSQDRDLVRNKLMHCISLNKTYRDTYIFVKNQPFLPNTEQFSFSENYVFGKFDTFCKRLNKIITMFDLMDDYNHLFEKRMEGLLLGEDLEEAMHAFEEAKKAVTTCQYDYLDYRNDDFDKDYQAFQDKTNALRESIGSTIEINFSSVWETPQGIKFLTRFEKVSQKIQIIKLNEKYGRVLKYSEKEVDKIMKMFKRQKEDPPLPRNYSPVAGRIKWARCLMYNMTETVESVCAHPVLRALPAAADMLRKYQATKSLIHNYETTMSAVWMNQNVWDVDDSLNNTLLKIDDTGQIGVNLDHTIKLLIRESDCLVKMGIDLPIVCHSLYSKKNYFTLVNDSLQFLLEDYLRCVRQVKLEVRPLLLPQVVRLSSLLLPGLRSVTWTSEDWKEFVDRANAAINSFDVLVTRVHDIYTNRIIYVLSGMQEVTLITLPEETPWAVDEFIEYVEKKCRNACVELNRKSLMVEEAVEEVLDLVKKAAQQIKPAEINPDFEFLIAEDDVHGSATVSTLNESTSSGQQDWSAVWECFESPHRLLSIPAGGLSKSMQEMVKNAVSEMRRYYSRKVIDVLIKVTRRALDLIIKQISQDFEATVFANGNISAPVSYSKDPHPPPPSTNFYATVSPISLCTLTKITLYIKNFLKVITRLSSGNTDFLRPVFLMSRIVALQSLSPSPLLDNGISHIRHCARFRFLHLRSNKASSSVSWSQSILLLSVQNAEVIPRARDLVAASARVRCAFKSFAYRQCVKALRLDSTRYKLFHHAQDTTYYCACVLAFLTTSFNLYVPGFCECYAKKPIFLLHAALVIPNVLVKPTLEEIQEVLVLAGKHISGLSKGVAQWTGDKSTRVSWKKLTGHQSNQLLQVVTKLDEQVQTVAPMNVAKSMKMIEAAKMRKKKYYRLESEEKPMFPFQQKSFYSHVMENKEIIKTLTLLSLCTQNIKTELNTLVKRWRPYHYLWKCEKTLRQLLSWNLNDFELALKRHSELELKLSTEPDILVIGNCLAVSTEKLKLGLMTELKNGTHRISQAMRKKYKREMDYVYAIMNDLERKLERPIRDLDDVRTVMETLKKIREQEVDMELKIDPVEEAFNVITRYELSVSKEDMEQVDNLRYSWQQLQATALASHVQLLKMQPQFEEDLKNNLERFRDDNSDYCHEYRHAGPMQSGLTPREASDRLILFQNRFDGMWRKLQTYQNGEELFGLPHTEYPELAQIRKELNLLQKLYKLYNDVIDRVSSYYDIPWGEVNIEEINNELMEFQNRCRKLPKGLKEWPAFYALKKTIDDFNDMCPLLELMANKAMKPRHWQRIMEVTKYIFELDNEDFCLKNILEAPLLPNKEDIEDICISAMKEKDIEAKLRQVTNEWSVHELTFQTFNNRGELLLRGDTTAETIGQLEDSLMILGSLLSNRYNAPFRKQIQQWLYDLQSTNEILERWLLVQNMWVYLEAVFVGGDIAKQLPKEAKRFSKIDKSWQKIMQRAHETPGVVSCCVGDDLLRQLLPHLQEQLELCQKSLSGYLEKKRTMFPRFFFVSDPALLEILGQASDSHTIQNHLLSIFDNIRYVKFHDIEYNKMISIVSSEGEEIKLERPVRAEGSVETWLTSLLQSAQSSLHSIIRNAVSLINDPVFNLLLFLDKMPAQVGLLGIQIIWTRDAELALMQARQDKKIMLETNNKFLELLNTLIDQTTRDLSKIERIKFETLITIHVHQRDIFDMLCRLNVRSANDFEWLKQCRFYFKEDVDKTWISVTDVTFTYQNEYLGCTERLVITPLTDRCYITLAQALAMSMGGAPCGPAGTGKTETVKDMGKTLAKYVVVFNCSDQMDYRGLGRIYKGLAQSGSWGCFDEFNRIELPVLSVAAQQVAVVLAAKKEKKKTFLFTDGDMSDMCPEFGIFITMNPGYAGRKELPENLKIQFRTVAMMVPDRQIIIRVKLASCGFLENITLARKFYTLYKLCEEQLTKQVHYDFGLRNILSVLRTLGAVKRVNAKDNESTIVMRVLRDMNLSKLIDEDEPLFISLVADLFPNQVIEKTTYPDLEEAIRKLVDANGLVYHPPWVLKIVQLYETQRVRHGIMVLGPPGAGKTTCIHTVMSALSETEDPHREMRMNPKAITASQMFGRLDVATNDWTDGIFSALWRKTLKIKTGEHIWLVLDGPVDSIWIENLNSVLDDNKTLTLANGDRLTMSPTSKIIFEPENIDNASPATVSRNGMVYMSSSGLDWEPVLNAWLKTRSVREDEVLSTLFEQTFPNTYTWCTQNLSFSMRVLQSNIISQMLNLLEGLVPPQIVETEEPSASKSVNGDMEDDEEKEKGEEIQLYTPEHLHKIYVFSLVWGFGSLLETGDRIKYDKYIKETYREILDIPKHPHNKPSMLFDFYVKQHGKWELWEDLMTNYQYPDTATPDYANILIPIVDNVRINYLIHCIAKQGKAVLLLGEQGSAKTVMMKAYMKNANPDQFMGRSFNFSSATSPYQFQKTIESYVEKRSGMTFGPPGGKKMLVFIDDINLPQINEWGDQITNEIVRQTMSMGGFYSLEKPGDFTTIVDIQFLGAMGQPGGGRNDIPARLKRRFSIFNCPLPNNDSIDKIFKVIGEGHYNAKRGFTAEVRSLIKKIIPLTRELWTRTRINLLPTPAKFHYVFSLRDLSRVWQGMVGTLPTVIESEKCLMLLWKHECSRVFSDRFTHQSDKDWFNKALYNIAEEILGAEYKKMMEKDPVFVDFMRDAPEPTGEEGEDADMELPKVYEPVFDYSELRDRLEMFLSQFNEMVRGSGMDLVFFPDAMLHLVKISRVIRHPRGNVMLVGVGGSGKQSLTKLSTFIAGYRSFQIALTRSYNVGNFLEDLKLLYRSCGVQGKGTTFIFTDLDIKEEGFLEYLNNILSSGVISNLFTKDEQQEIISELTPIMKRENQKRTLTNELVMEYFLNRTCQNLHVVLCFSPVSEAFRYRAMRFPALISGCTIDWFQPWPKDALVSVADHFLADFEIECSKEVKKELVTVLGTIQDVVSTVSTEYFQRFRRSSHVTPKSYLSFIGGYKTIYQMKQKELGDGALRMDTGLEKLREASISVEVLKKDLAVMEQDLALASEKADRVLSEVTERAMQAEIVKNQVQVVKEKAEALVAFIAEEKEKAERKLEAAKPALEEAEAALNTIKPAHIATVRKLGRPPHLIMRIMDCVLILFQRRLHPIIPDTAAPCPKPSWAESLKACK